MAMMGPGKTSRNSDRVIGVPSCQISVGAVRGFLASLRDRKAGSACLITRTANAHHLDVETKTLLARHLSRLTLTLEGAFERARAAGELRPEADPTSLAALLLVTAQGVSAICALPDSESRIHAAVTGLEQWIEALTPRAPNRSPPSRKGTPAPAP